MKRLVTRIKSIQCLMAVICLAMSVVMSVSCFYPRERRQYIEPLGLYFKINYYVDDNEIRISFGKKEDSVYTNYYETWWDVGGGSYPLYFIVDNTASAPKVMYIVVNPNGFFDVSIPDYPYSIDPYSWIEKKENFGDYIRDLPSEGNDDPSCADYYIVGVYQGGYYKKLVYRTYNLGAMDDVYTFIETFVKTSTFVSFTGLQEKEVHTGYQENVVSYGEPITTDKFTVTEETIKTIKRSGWLFLDTMDIRHEPVLEIDKWNVDDNHILSIIYRIGPDGDRVPVNGARYHKAMEAHSLHVWYQ